ncbi:MAG: helix-turn-helix transcriptional regulator [Thermodesulfobacteriota bacterium]|nr:helix-turn-helix transcriptional regulator [Thermodesulfobacteriota bacterium]
MTPDEIKDALKKNKTTQKVIAQKLGKSEMLISLVVNKKTTSDEAMREVARVIGKDKVEVFPEYYFGPKHRSTSKVASCAA